MVTAPRPEERPANPRLWDVLIVGAGPAGCAAALFAALGGCTVLLTEKCAVGGGMLQAPEIHDWPGEVCPIDGIALGERMRKQVLAAGAVLRYGEVTAVSLPAPTDTVTVLFSSAPAPDGTRHHTELHARNLILAAGDTSPPLVPGLLSPENSPSPSSCRTGIPHIYAVGYCRSPECSRIVTSCADGCRAAMDILGEVRSKR